MLTDKGTSVVLGCFNELHVLRAQELDVDPWSKDVPSASFKGDSIDEGERNMPPPKCYIYNCSDSSTDAMDSKRIIPRARSPSDIQ